MIWVVRHDHRRSLKAQKLQAKQDISRLFLVPGVNFMRQKFRGKLHLAELLWTLDKLFSMFYAESKFLSDWEEIYAQLCFMTLALGLQTWAEAWARSSSSRIRLKRPERVTNWWRHRLVCKPKKLATANDETSAHRLLLLGQAWWWTGQL